MAGRLWLAFGHFPFAFNSGACSMYVRCKLTGRFIPAKLAKADRIPRLKRHFHFRFGPAGERANLISSK